MRVKQGCQAALEQWTWQYNHWIGNTGEGGELYTDVALSDLNFTWTGSQITRTFSVPISSLVDKHRDFPEIPAWNWATPRTIVGFLPITRTDAPDSRRLENSVYPMDLRWQVVAVAPGGTFSGWPDWNPNGIGERTYDCAFPTPVAITAPTSGSTITGPVTITAAASDNVGVTAVDFRVDNVLLARDNLAPYSSHGTPHLPRPAPTLS